MEIASLPLFYAGKNLAGGNASLAASAKDLERIRSHSRACHQPEEQSNECLPKENSGEEQLEVLEKRLNSLSANLHTLRTEFLRNEALIEKLIAYRLNI